MSTSRSSSPNRFEPLSDEEFSDDADSRSPPPQARPLRNISPNTRTAYAARASARRAALRESHPVGRPTTPSPGLRASFADVVAGVAATAAPHPQISADARRSETTLAPSLGETAAHNGAADENTVPTAPSRTVASTNPSHKGARTRL